MTDADARVAALEATVAQLTTRVQELEDDRAIRDLLARYGYTADNCDDEGFVELYTDDGGIVLSISPEAQRAMGTDAAVWRGKDGVREFITHPKGHHSPELYGKSMHLHGTNLVTHIDGDEAVADSYGIALATADGDNTIVSAGNNRWQLRREGGQWRIRERRGASLGDDKFATNVDGPVDGAAP
jgi:hypothetical protein